MLSNHHIFCCLFFCLQSFPAIGSFLMSWFFATGGQSIGASASASVGPSNEWAGPISFRIDWLLSWAPVSLSATFLVSRRIFGWIDISSHLQNSVQKTLMLETPGWKYCKKTIAEINCVVPYRYFVNSLKWFPYMYHFLDHFIKSLDKKTGEWKEEIAHP